jgi:hypothetical protein
MKYLIKDENGEVMQIVGRREEARQIVSLRDGWTFKQYRELKTVYMFEEAPF